VIDLNALAVFAQVVEAGSFTGGARALGLPKGSVSRKISGLEAALGVRLLHRTTRKLSLTEVGRAYYAQCRKGLVELDAANQLVKETRSVPSGTLRISAPADFGGGGLADWVEAFLKRYDQVRIELVLSDRYVDLIERCGTPPSSPAGWARPAGSSAPAPITSPVEVSPRIWTIFETMTPSSMAPRWRARCGTCVDRRATQPSRSRGVSPATA
jgi:DNA-binding transcriptional LysR family regulator